MPAFFNSLSVGEPDEDGDIRVEGDLVITNETSTPVYQVQYKLLYLGADTACLYEEESYEDAFVAPGDSTTVSTWNRINQRDVTEPTIDLRAIGALCRRDFVRLGEIAMPESGESVRLSTQVDFDWYSGPLTLIFSRTEPDSDGDFNLEFKCLVDNKTDQLLKAMLKAQIIDAEGAEIETSDTEEDIRGGSAKLLSGSFWRPKAGQLEGGKVLFSLKALMPIDSFDVRETADLSDF